MHLLIGLGAAITGVLLSIGVLGGLPLWQWLSSSRHHNASSMYEHNPWMFDEYDQDDDLPPM